MTKHKHDKHKRVAGKDTPPAATDFTAPVPIQPAVSASSPISPLQAMSCAMQAAQEAGRAAQRTVANASIAQTLITETKVLSTEQPRLKASILSPSPHRSSG